MAQSRLPAKLKFHSLNVEDGLPNNTVNAIVQDSLGFIWIGTNDGLCRYDGMNYRYYKESLKEHNGLSNNFVQSLFLDKDGKLWIMTDQGLNKYDPTFERFDTYTVDDGLSYNSVTKMTQGADGMYYIGTYGGGLDVFNGEEFIRNFSPNSDDPLASFLISDIEIQGENSLWVATWYSGICKIDLKDGSVKNFGSGENTITPSGRINDIYLDQSGFLWIATDKGLTIYNTLDDSYTLISMENSPHLVDNDILSIFEHSNGELWFGTRNAGIVKTLRRELLSNKQSTVFKGHAPNGTDESVHHRTVNYLYEDDQGNIWIGSHKGGVDIVQPSGEIIHYYPKLTEDNLKETQSVWGINQTQDGKLWLGTDGDGLVLFDPVSNETKHFKHDLDNVNSLSDNAILTLLEDSKQNVWIGTYAGGISKYHVDKNQFKNYMTGYLPESINSNDVRVIFEDSSARIWVGSNGGGLQRYNEDSDDFEFMQEVGWIDIRTIAEDGNGTLWLGTFGNGLLSFDPASNTLKEYPEIQKIDSHIIFSLYIDTEDQIWIGTRYKGLLKFDPENDTLEQITEVNGLTNNTIQSIVPDHEGNIWLSTNDGVNMLNRDTGNIIQYKSSSGIQAGQFNNNSGFLSNDGYLVFGGINGMNIFYPEWALKRNLPEKILITDFKLFNESVSVTTKDKESPLKTNISEANLLTLSHDQNDITLSYVGLSLPFAQDLNYAYKLNHFDKDWNFVGKSTAAVYRNIPPGDYLFQVAIVEDSGELGLLKEITVIIRPPFWLTWPAILIYGAVIIAVLIMIAKYYGRQIKLRNSLFYEKKLRQKEADLNQERFRFFTSFSHELRTPLTLILGPVKDMIRTEKNESKLEKLHMIKRNSNVLLELINKMLEFRKTETEHNHLEIGQYSFDNFVSEIHSNFGFYANQKSIKFELKESGLSEIWFDYKKIQLVINNILSNAFKYTPQGGFIRMIIKEKEGWIVLSVKDSGPGISNEALSSIFDLYFHSDLDEVIDGTGIGLALCKKLMDLHGGRIEAKSKLGMGAQFSIYLHKSKSHYEGMENVEFLTNNRYVVRKPFLKSSSLPEKSTVDRIEKDDRVILVIDDNQDVVRYVSDILSGQYKIITAKDGQQGIEMALKYIPDLIISDIMMPNKSGTELCEELKNRSQTSHIPIVFLTAKLESENQLKSMNLGADAYITKPFDSAFLKARVQNLFLNRVKLIKHYQGNKEESVSTIPEPLEDKFLNRMEQLIIEQFDGKDQSIPELAKNLGFSRSSLYRKVKALTGLSINQFVRKVRLNRAAKLIDQGEMNISQVAFEVGFNDLKYFRNCFKEQFGVVPSIYRKRKLVKADS
ncbi:hybrid sensor histidine kinase/response regulator transcription factor [Lutimonas sp.]|uniref:hybrid sensor histidine kinase/response regulator transcription factor n=1 Tax=Lutimonas sp. TaxID=1872403 RepID=UPI003D9B7EE0